MNEINLNLNELNKYIQAKYDEKHLNENAITREEAWTYLIRTERLVNALTNENEEKIDIKTNFLNDEQEIDSNLEKIYHKYNLKLKETKLDLLIGLDELSSCLNDLIKILIENYFNFQTLFPMSNNKKLNFKIENILVCGLESSSMLMQITSILAKYQSLFEINSKNSSLPLLKIFKLDFNDIIATNNINEIELVFKSIQMLNKNKQPVVVLLVNLELLFSGEINSIKLHLLGDLLYECSSSSSRIFICISDSPWLLHPALVYRFENCILCPQLSSQNKSILFESLLNKFNSKLNLKNDLIKLSEPYFLTSNLVYSLIEKLKPVILAKPASKAWKRLKTELDVLKRFNRIKALKQNNSFSHQEEDLNQLREECLHEAKKFLEMNHLNESWYTKYELFKINYRSQFDFP